MTGSFVITCGHACNPVEFYISTDQDSFHYDRRKRKNKPWKVKDREVRVIVDSFIFTFNLDCENAQCSSNVI